jgi:hyperosmotically inducible protein
MKTINISTAATLAAALGASLALAACQPAQNDAASTPAAPTATTTPGQVSESATAMADKVADAVGDAAVTVAVNAELAKDTQLSALRIDVDTLDGRVTLAGSAPNDAARDRATALAQGVKGVKSVDNRLAVAPTS